MENQDAQLKRMLNTVREKLNTNYKYEKNDDIKEFEDMEKKKMRRLKLTKRKQKQQNKVVETMSKQNMLKTKKAVNKSNKELKLNENGLIMKKQNAKMTHTKTDKEQNVMPQNTLKAKNKIAKKKEDNEKMFSKGAIGKVSVDKEEEESNSTLVLSDSKEGKAQNFQKDQGFINEFKKKNDRELIDRENLQINVVKAENEANMPETFEDLNICEEILSCIHELGWKKPTLIQKQVLPLAFQKRDIIGLSETGSGKSACFIIPILQELKEKKKSFFALVVAPTRELCIQISQHFNALGANMLIQVASIFGGVDILSQSLQLAKKPNIIVGTPGRILDHLKNTSGFNLNNLKYLVFDEADKLLSLDFETSINKLLLILPQRRVTFLFSATMTEKVAKLKKASLKNPVKVEASNKFSTASTLIESFLFVPFKYKYVYLASLCFHFGNSSMIIFANTCSVAQKLTFFCRNLGLSAICLHGKLTQTQRISSLNAFRSKKYNILISTPVGSRGLDLQEIKVVINFDVCSCKEYIHRVGRTARAGRTGKSITIVTQYDVEQFLELENQMNKKIPKFTDLDPMDVMLNQDKSLEAMRLAEMEMKDNKDLYRNKKYQKANRGRH